MKFGEKIKKQLIGSRQVGQRLQQLFIFLTLSRKVVIGKWFSQVFTHPVLLPLGHYSDKMLLSRYLTQHKKWIQVFPRSTPWTQQPQSKLQFLCWDPLKWITKELPYTWDVNWSTNKKIIFMVDITNQYS